MSFTSASWLGRTEVLHPALNATSMGMDIGLPRRVWEILKSFPLSTATLVFTMTESHLAGQWKRKYHRGMVKLLNRQVNVSNMSA